MNEANDSLWARVVSMATFQLCVWIFVYSFFDDIFETKICLI